MTRSWIVIALFFASVSSAEYRFTYTNPTVGDTDAPVLLEYFSSVDCAYCLTFERDTLGALRDLIDGGELQVVFRDIPPPHPYMSIANDIFCVQEFPDYLSARLAYKQGPGTIQNIQPQLSGRKGERFNQCLSNLAAWPVLQHNKQTFDRLQFPGTPGFRLTARVAGRPVVTQFAGSIKPGSLRQSISRIQHSNSTRTSTR